MAKEELSLEQLAKEIYKGAGGMNNVESVTHCMTRVRMSVRDRDEVNEAQLKAIPGVLGVVDDEHNYKSLSVLAKSIKSQKKWQVKQVSL